MLEQKRKIVEGLKMRSKVWDESDSIYRDYNANDSFIMICSEVNNIYMSLFNHGKYENTKLATASILPNREEISTLLLHNKKHTVPPKAYPSNAPKKLAATKYALLSRTSLPI
jgi:hypothetical protein